MAEHATVDVVVPIYGALHTVRRCLDSVVRWTDPAAGRLVLVNDGSDHHTSAYLRDFAAGADGVTLIENPRNLGFVRSCNRGFGCSTGDYVVLLNSDTCVTPRWLDKMVACMRSDPRIGVASPISNFAPHMVIEMLPGLDYLAMNALIEVHSPRAYPDVTTPEGFCFMVSRACLEAIGGFDPVFDWGYVEESDLSMRANYFGFRTVCVDDTYIYHRGRASFGVSQRDERYNANKTIFHRRWKPRYADDVAAFRQRDPLGGLRSELSALRPEEYLVRG